MEQRFRRVRKQLDELGYMQVLIPESLPLVEKLTADLVQTTESLQKYKKIAKNALEEQDNLQLGAQPYKCDNAKLVRECNDLHLAFLQVREKSEKAQKDLKRRFSNLEKEKLDCETECEKLRRRIRDLELESAKKTDRILAIQNKSLQTGAKTAGRSSSTFASKSRTSTASKSTTEISTTMAMGDQKIAMLTKEIQNLKDEQLQMAELTETYKNQLNNRDREIQRLNQMLEGGRPLQALNQDCCYKDVEAKLYRMEKEVRSLEKDKFDLEVRLKESVAKQHEAMKRALNLAERNKQLEKELREIDQMALAVEADCNSTIKMNAEKVVTLQERVHDTVLQIQSLEREVTELKRDKQELLLDLDALKLEKNHLQSVLETALDDKKRLNDRINQFTVIEHDLNLEIDRLVQASANQKRKIAELECKLVAGKFDAVTDRSTVLESSTAVDRVKSERDYYMKEYHRLMEQMKNIPSQPNNQSELVQKLRDSEQSLASLQHENKTLAQEKHNLMTRLETARDHADGDYDSFSLKSSVRRLERERDILKADITRLEEERDAVRQHLKSLSEKQNTEAIRLEKALRDAEDQIKRLEQERRELMQTQGSRRATISGLEDQCDTLKNQLQQCQTELNHQRLLYTQLKTLHEQTDKALGDSQGQLAQVENVIASYQDRVGDLDKERGLHSQEVASLKNDIMVMKGNLAQIDQEKDALLIVVDDKTEKLALMEHELQAKEDKLRTLENTVADLKKKLSLTVDSSSAREKMLRSASIESASLRQDLETASRAKDSAIHENRRLQDDLSACAADCRCARNELDVSKRQIEDLKRQLQHYVAEVKRFEDLMTKKEVERTELLDQFRSLSQEAEMLESNNHSLESEAAQSKVQLSVTLDHVNDLESKLTNQDDTISGYEKKIAELSSQVTNLESQLCHCQQQQERTEADLGSVRDLCMKLDKQKDNLSRELNEKEEQRSLVDRDMLRLRRESQTLQETLAKDRMSADNLERLLADARQDSVQLRLRNQEMEAEIQRLKEKIEELQTKLSPTTATFTYSANIATPGSKVSTFCGSCKAGSTSAQNDQGDLIDTSSAVILRASPKNEQFNSNVKAEVVAEMKAPLLKPTEEKNLTPRSENLQKPLRSYARSPYVPPSEKQAGAVNASSYSRPAYNSAYDVPSTKIASYSYASSVASKRQQPQPYGSTYFKSTSASPSSAVNADSHLPKNNQDFSTHDQQTCQNCNSCDTKFQSAYKASVVGGNLPAATGMDSGYKGCDSSSNCPAQSRYTSHYSAAKDQ